MRQWRLLRRLEVTQKGVTISTIAREEDVHPRTLKRDLIALRQAGFPVLEERVHSERRWRLPDDYARAPSFPVTSSELIALALARPQLRALDGTDIARAMDELISKVESTLAPAARSLLTRLRAVVSGERPRAQYGDVPARLIEAAAERFSAEIVYDSAWRRAITHRKIDPYAVRLHHGTLYVAAFDHLRRAVRLFAVERIRKLSTTREHFEAPNFDAEEYFGRPLGVVHEGKPYEVRVRFSPETSVFVEERPWHPSQKIERRGDGSIDVTLKIDGLREVASRILGFGPRARALAPPELIELVARELREASVQYEPQVGGRAAAAALVAQRTG